jgi:hypothetical protein
MAIEKKNTYVPGSNQDLTNAVANIDINRTGEDLVSVEYSAPNFLIKVGSLIEANGNMYAVTTADESITAADGNLIFNESTGFAINNVDTPVYDPAKGGYYVNGTERVTKFRLNSDGTFYEKNATSKPGTNSLTNVVYHFRSTSGQTASSNVHSFLDNIWDIHNLPDDVPIPANGKMNESAGTVGGTTTDRINIYAPYTLGTAAIEKLWIFSIRRNSANGNYIFEGEVELTGTGSASISSIAHGFVESVSPRAHIINCCIMPMSSIQSVQVI